MAEIRHHAIDLRKLRDLRDMLGDDEAVLEVLEVYSTSASEGVQVIRDAMERRNDEAIGAAAHRLKSSSFAIGAAVLGQLCAELEAAAAARDWTAIDNARPAFEEHSARVLSEARLLCGIGVRTA